jgi:uncharacterized protein YbjT (DUF2867 family)
MCESSGKWSGTVILVNGATGHVGRAVVSRLASLGHDVVAMVRDVQVLACPRHVSDS